ncbi:MAG: ECF transporter S component [Slackia sp.]|nr:ECF transporter S component [Slackia sp.]
MAAFHRVFSFAAEVVAIAAVPAALVACAWFGIEQTALVSMIVVASALLLFFAGYEARRPRLREIMPVAVLAALAAAGRILFAPFPSFKPVSAIAIIAGAVFGRRAGFMTGALAALASNFFFGQGPWTPWQMYAWGMIGYGAGLLAQAGVAKSLPAMCAYGFASGFAYGLVLNLWSIVGFFHPTDFAQVLAVYAAALPFDATHAVATVAFLLALYAPWRRKLARIARKYGLVPALSPSCGRGVLSCDTKEVRQ